MPTIEQLNKRAEELKKKSEAYRERMTKNSSETERDKEIEEFIARIKESIRKKREEQEKAKKEAIQNVWKTQPEKDAKKIMSGTVKQTKRFESTISPKATAMQAINPKRTYATDSLGNAYDKTENKSTKDMLPQMKGTGQLKNYTKKELKNKDVNPLTYTKNKQKENEEKKNTELKEYENQKNQYVKNVKNTLSSFDTETFSKFEKESDKKIATLNKQLSKEKDKTKKKQLKEQIKEAENEKQQYKAFGVYKKYGIDIEKFSADDYKKISKNLSKEENEILWSLAELNHYGNYSKTMGNAPLNPFGTKLLNAGTLGLYDKINNEITKKASQKTGLTGLSNSYATENEKIEKEHPVQSFTGDFAGSLLAMEAVGGLVGTGAKALGFENGIKNVSNGTKLFSKLSLNTQKALETSATMGLTSGISSAINQDWNKDDWYKQVGNVALDTVTSSAGAFLGSTLSSKVAENTFLKLRESGLSEKAVKALCSVNGALAFSATTTAVTEQKNALKSIAKGEKYSPDWGNIAENILVSALYSGISTYTREALGGTMRNAEQSFEYFTAEDMKDPAKLKKKYREYAKEYHPDKGGDQDVMQKITAEYAMAKEQCAKYTASKLKKAYKNNKSTAKERETAKNNAIILLNDIYENSDVVAVASTTNVSENKSNENAVDVAKEKIGTDIEKTDEIPLTNEKDSGKIEVDELPFTEKQAVMQYKSSESYKINENLRKNSDLSETDRTLFNNLKSALSKSPSYEGTVYRNMPFYFKEDFDSFINEHNGKDSIVYRDFTSASKAPDGYLIDSNVVPYVVHYEIVSHNAKDIEKYGNAEEREVLFDTDTKFKINSFEVKGNEIFIKCEESVASGTEEIDRTYQNERNGQQAPSNGSGNEHIGISERVYNDDGLLRVGSTDNDNILNAESAGDGTGNREETDRYSGNTPQENGNARVSETRISGLSEQKTVQAQPTNVETVQEYGFDENFEINENGNVILKQNNIDYDDKTMRAGKFKVVTAHKNAVEKNGFVYGKYGITKEKDNSYGVTHLPSGYGCGNFDSLKEAKQFITALDEVTENVPVAFELSGAPLPEFVNENFLPQMDKTINELREKGDYKNIDVYPQRIKDGKVPFKTKTQLIEYMKNRIGDKVKVIKQTGETDIRTITAVNGDVSYRMTNANGKEVFAYFPEKEKIRITDTGFSALDDMGNERYSLDFVNVDEQSIQSAQQTPTQTQDNENTQEVHSPAPTQKATEATAEAAKETKSAVKEIDTDSFLGAIDNAYSSQKIGETIKMSDYEKKETTAEENKNIISTTDINSYTENMPAMQKANVTKTLEKSFPTKEYGALTYAEFINRSLQDGKNLEIQKDLKNTIVNAKNNFNFSKDVTRSFEANKAKYHSRGMNNFGLAKEARELSRNKIGGENIKAVDPKLYYCMTGDETVLPDSCFNTTYCVTDENGYYSVPKTVYDYGVWVEENKAVAEENKVTAKENTQKTTVNEKTKAEQTADKKRLEAVFRRMKEKKEVNENTDLTFTEKQAVMQYKSFEGYLINRAIRNGEHLTEEQETMRKNLSNALSKSPSYEGTVYRNIGFYTESEFNDFVKEHNGKDSVVYKDFVSASKIPDGYNVDMEYVAHYEIESLSAKDIEKYGIQEEREVLFDTDTEFKINSFEVKGNEIFIKCEEINNATENNRTNQEKGNRLQNSSNGSGIEHIGVSERVHNANDSVRVGSTDNDNVLNAESAGNGTGNNGKTERNGRNVEEKDRNVNISERKSAGIKDIESQNSEKGEKQDVHGRVLDSESRGHGNGAVSENLQTEEKRENAQSVDGRNRSSGNEQLRQDSRAVESNSSSAGHLEHTESHPGTNSDKQLRERNNSEGNDGRIHQVPDRKLNKNNYTVSSEIDDISPGHYKNIEAIKLLKQLESEGRIATKEEKDILARYKGWGGLKDSFLGYNNEQLKNLLTDEEYKNARASILNAHYTPTKVIDEMYKGLKRLGFKGGNILEPSLGVGNFFGRMPTAISSKSNLYGVELDSITGRIAKQLYPDADISVMPFQDVGYEDNTFDLIITNVPFSEVRYPYKKSSYTLHDYFIVKSVDKLKENGIGMFITSSGTLDKLDIKARNEITNKADIIACYRLPNNTFTKNANAQVTTDIIILQKREKDEVQKGEKIENIGSLNGVAINEYYENHPENVLGELTYQSGPYGERSQVLPDGRDVGEALNKAMKKLPKDLISGNVELKAVSVAIGANEKSHFIYENNKAYFINAETKERSTPYGAKRGNVIKDYLDLKNTYNKFMDYHTSSYLYTTAELAEVKTELNNAYDNFFEKHGALQEKDNKFLSDDNSFIRITGLEIYDSKTKAYTKSDIFTKDTVIYKKPTKAQNAQDALAISVNETGGVDFERMSELTDSSKEKLTEELGDSIIKTPDGNYELVDVYLSGNIREKLKKAESTKGFEKNAELLRSVMPKDKTPSQIVPKLGAPWIDKRYIQDFIVEIFDCYSRPDITFDKTTCTWSLSNVNGSYHNLYEKYGTKGADGGRLLEATLNNKFVTVYNMDKSGKRILNTEETANARQKQVEIREAFSDWIFKDKNRRETLTKKYNELFNSHRNMEYSRLSKYLTFPGINDSFKLRDYQKEAVAMTVFGGNSLLAHGVGTGKTCEMIASAMELKRMGIVHKSMMVVPKTKVGDFRTEILKTYPNAKVLMATEKDFEKQNRKKLFSQIATNDWDIVVIGHSSFNLIPLSGHTQGMQIEKEISEIEDVITSAQLEKTNRLNRRFLSGLSKSLESRKMKLKKLLSMPKDDVMTFEEMGIDGIFVDEAHNFKNLSFYTKLNIAGIKSGEAKRATDLKMKCDYIRSKDGRIVFATATPITNTISEMYNMTKYLRPEIFEEAQIYSFDAWASNYGNVEVKVEMSPDGVNFRTKERFSKYDNVQEMVGMFRRYASVLKTSDVVKDLPRAKYVDVISPSTEIHEKYLAEIVKRMKSPDKYDNMLLITNDGRAMATDLRLVMSQLSGYNARQLDLPESRINKAVENIVSEYKNSSERKGTQFVFLDYGISSQGGRYSFNLYEDIINKLVKRGIPEKEIAKIGDYETSAKKDELFAKMNNGEIRVLLGSTAKMGEGVNAQKKAVALHHLNAPYRPSDIEQREGRIIRFGNENKDVTIYRYIQEKSFDSYMWQMLARKAEFINQAMSGGEIDELEETSDFVLSAKEGMAIASGNPLIMEKITVDEEVKKLRGFQKSYNANLYAMEERKGKLPIEIQKTQFELEKASTDVKTVEENDTSDFEITIDGKKYDNRNKAGEALEKAVAKYNSDTHAQIGKYRGLDIVFDKGNGGFGIDMYLQGENKYFIEYGNSMSGNITKLVNCSEHPIKEKEKFEKLLKRQKDDLKQIETEIKTPFKYQNELEQALKKQGDILAELQMDKIDSRDIEDVPDDTSSYDNNGESYDLYDSAELERWNTEKYIFTQEPKKKLQKPSQKRSNVISPHEIINMISEKLGVPISKGNIRVKNARGIYKEKPNTIRLKTSDNVPTACHEVGHWIDKQTELSQNKHIKEVINKLDKDFAKNYSQEKLPGEAVAEFIREYLQNPGKATEKYPLFSKDFKTSLESIGILKDIDDIAFAVNKYMSSTVSERFSSVVVTDTKPKKTPEEKRSDFYTKFVDSYHPIKKATDYVEKVAGKQSGASNGYKLATNSRNADTIANHLLTQEMTDLKGNKVGLSLKDCIKDVDPSNLPAFYEYLVLKHAPSWIAPENLGIKKRVFADDTLEDIDLINDEIRILEEKFPEFVTSAQKLYKYQDNLNKYYLVETGGMTEDTYNLLKKLYPCYVPMKRFVQSTNGKQKGSFANQFSPIRRAKGSTEAIVNPIQSIVEHTHNVVKFATRNRVMQTLADYADKVEGFGRFMEKVPPDMVGREFGMTEYKTKIGDILQEKLNADDYISVTDVIDDVLSDNITAWTPVALKSKQIVTVMKNGEMQYYQVHDKELYKSIAELTPQQAKSVMDWATATMQVMKVLITSNNPIFAGTNAMRDFSTAFRNTDENNFLKFSADYVKAFLDVVGKTDAYKLYLAMGGGHSSELSANHDRMKKQLRLLAKEDLSLAKRVQASLLHPLDTVSDLIGVIADFNDVIETIPRLSEFKRVLEKSGDVEEAIYKADDITTNFKRSGEYGRELNKKVMFANAHIQSIDKLVRSFSEGTKDKILKRIFKYLFSAMCTTALQMWWNKSKDEEDYSNLSSYLKNNFYNFALGNGKFLSIPKPREMAVFDSLMERSYETLFTDATFSEAFYGFGGYMAQQLMPSFIPTDFSSWEAVVNGIFGNTIFGGLTELAVNEDFKGTPIVSKAYKDLPKKEQYNERTTITAKAIGNLFGISPMEVDHLIDNYTGIFGQINRAVMVEDKSQRDWTFGLKNKFIKDAYYSTDVINKVYDGKDKAKKKYEKNPTSKSLALYEKYSAKAAFVTEYSKIVNELPEDEKRQARKKLLKKLDGWNMEYTQAEKNIANKLDKASIEDADDIYIINSGAYKSTDFPKSTLEKTMNKEKYSYTMTPDEYIEYVDDFMKTLDNERKKIADKNFNEEKTQLRLKEALSETKTSLNEKYKQKYFKKFVKKEN